MNHIKHFFFGLILLISYVVPSQAKEVQEQQKKVEDANTADFMTMMEFQQSIVNEANKQLVPFIVQNYEKLVKTAVPKDDPRIDAAIKDFVLKEAAAIRKTLEQLVNTSFGTMPAKEKNTFVLQAIQWFNEIFVSVAKQYLDVHSQVAAELKKAATELASPKVSAATKKPALQTSPVK